MITYDSFSSFVCPIYVFPGLTSRNISKQKYLPSLRTVYPVYFCLPCAFVQ